MLMVALFVLLFLMLVTAAFRGSFQAALVYSITVLMLAVLILARFGGDLGRTQ